MSERNDGSREEVIHQVRSELAEAMGNIATKHNASIDECCIALFQLAGSATALARDDKESYMEDITWAIKNLTGAYSVTKGVAVRVDEPYELEKLLQ